MPSPLIPPTTCNSDSSSSNQACVKSALEAAKRHVATSSASTSTRPRIPAPEKLVSKASIAPAWEFLSQVGPEMLKEEHDLDTPDRLPPSNIGKQQVKKVFQSIDSSVNAKEVEWLLNKDMTDSTVTFDELYGIVKDGSVGGFDPAAEAFKFLSKDGFVDINQVCEIFQTLGAKGMTPHIMSLITRRMLEDSRARGRDVQDNTIDLEMFRKLCVDGGPVEEIVVQVQERASPPLLTRGLNLFSKRGRADLHPRQLERALQGWHL
ncbi:unnamed protein product [Polarella glacialis]|uniref:Uncharacterized protein n=1 Tax=Polarella glacialis TaxID=89957 RepID=A0A813HFG4_POLGL|nr:unnamed protein product [Polarella glacialis]CAE8648216.1 unnamed protein product [Polarella glacialis]